MNKSERQSSILAYLTANTFGSLQEIVTAVGASESTVKRDLKELGDIGRIRRMRGGAMIVDDSKIDVAYLTKLQTYINDDAKTDVAMRAVTHIHDNDCLFMDSSSTVLHMVPLMKDFDALSIVTNSVLTAMLLSEYTNHNVSIIGGNVANKRFTVNDSRAVTQLLSYRFDSAFVSARAYSDEVMGENTENEAILKASLVGICSRIYGVITDDKYNGCYRYVSLASDEYELV